MYNDIEAAGIPPIKIDFYLQRNLERRYGKENQQSESNVARQNIQKYQKLGEMKQVRSGERREMKNGKLELNFHLKWKWFPFY